MNSNKITPSKSYYLPKNFVKPFHSWNFSCKKKHKVGLYNEKFYYSQDYKLMRDFFNGFKLKILKEPLFLNMKGNQLPIRKNSNILLIV